MKAIVEFTEDDYKKCNDRMKELRDMLKEDITNMRDYFFEERDKTSGYAHYKFSGKVKRKFKDILNESDIIMIIDNGYSSFGSSCFYNKETGDFGGRVNTD